MLIVGDVIVPNSQIESHWFRISADHCACNKILYLYKEDFEPVYKRDEAQMTLISTGLAILQKETPPHHPAISLEFI